MPRLEADDDTASEAIRAIRRSLKTDIVDVLRDKIPELAGRSRANAYDAIMNNPALLYRCFQVLRKEPAAFNHLLVDAQRRPVSDPSRLLSCGRSLGEVTALVVRAAARRYFRAKLGRGGTRRAEAARPEGWYERLLFWAGWPVNRPPARKTRGKSRAETLYQAMREHLLFDWQVPLIPMYSRMPVRLARRLGARLLELREPEQVRAMIAAESAQPGAAPVTAILTQLPASLIEVNGSINAEVMWKLAHDLAIPALFPGLDGADLRAAVAHVSATGPKMVASLLPLLGHDVKRLAVFLFSMEHALGTEKFRQSFGAEADPCATRAVELLLRETSAPSPAPEAMKEVADAIVKPLLHVLAGGDGGLPPSQDLSDPFAVVLLRPDPPGPGSRRQ